MTGPLQHHLTCLVRLGTADVLLTYLLAMEEDVELVEYVSAFVGETEGALAFALELCARRQMEGTT